ncbi:MAG TPA: potassium transporter TrkG [Burkholderiaceae bacterium]|nr:potassium transporter TrkG [Burkholderiaceae bacterium]
MTMLVPLALSHGARDAAVSAYDESILLTLAAGAGMWAATFRFKRELQARDGFLLVSLVWTLLPAFATLPLLFWSREVGAPMSFTDAYFETVSGMTTTGSTVMTGLDALPPSINLWRHLLVWIGGMGILVLAVAILPLLGVGGSQIFKAETPGPMKDSKLTPRITETAKGLYAVYVAITIACVLAYRAAGMNWFDALCHAFSTMGLGGFSTHDASFEYFKAHPWVDVAAMVFMVIASINFGMHFLAWRRRSFNVYVQCPEAVWTLTTLVGGSLLVSGFLFMREVTPSWAEALRWGFFNTLSIATSTGFASTDFDRWPIFAPALMLFLSCFATSSGSTGGGIKMIRAIVLFKQTKRELSRALHPRLVTPVRLSGVQVDNAVVYAILAFMLLYGLIIITGTFLLLATGLDEKSAFTAMVASINNTGPGLGRVGPAGNYQSLTDFQTWVCTATMLLGRLELFTLLVLFTTSFWRR